ncbi:MAG TPA: c-type cytochrome [Terracidiphilus sp.]|nr:c-type cytochrome [Terracidiphilus sp.]
MLKRLLLTAIALVFALGVGYAADQSGQKVVIPVDKTPANNGRQMFVSYCAPCHGVEGKGNGPAAAALKIPPTDLTVLSKKNHGRFPDTHIVAVMQFGADVPAHGSSQMPIWGPIFDKMSPANAQEKQLRINNLSRYIESLQAR